MTTVEMNPASEEASGQPTPGQMLRAAREARGLHLAVLSVTLKVPTRQLEALERDDYAAFKGVTFLRALAQSVCRQLGIDPAPVLAGLPKSTTSTNFVPQPLEMGSGTVTATADRSVQRGKGVSRQVLVLAILMLIGTAVLLWWPNPSSPLQPAVSDAELPPAEPLGQASNPQETPVSPGQTAPAASDAASVPAPSPAVTPNPASVGRVAEPATPGSPAAVASSAMSRPASDSALVEHIGPLSVRASADVWVEVRDRRGEMALKRQVKAGERVQLDVAAPLFVYVSRADSTEMSWRGRSVDLLSQAQNNETRLQIKP